MILPQHQQLSGESSISTDPESNDLSEDSLQQVEIITIIAMNHDVLEHSTQIASKSCPFTSIDVAFSSQNLIFTIISINQLSFIIQLPEFGVKQGARKPTAR